MEQQLRILRLKKKKLLFLCCVLACTLLLMGITCASGSDATYDDGGSALDKTMLSSMDFTQLKMFDANNGWAATPTSVLQTTDGGQHWTDVTPVDWEPLPVSPTADSSASEDTGITTATFLDMDHAWIVSETLPTSSIPTPNIGSPVTTATTTVSLPPQTFPVSIRATVDGGKTWMDAETFTVKNLAQVYPPYFINDSDGWLEMAVSGESSASTQSQNKPGGDTVYVVHTTDGGITWAPFFTRGVKLPGEGLKDGFSMNAYCTNQANTAPGFPACSSILSNTIITTPANQGCSTPLAGNTLGWTTVVDTNKVLIDETLNSTEGWHTITEAAPGGTPNQNGDSSVVTNAPLIFQDGADIVPVQVQSDPDGNDPSHYFLHLYLLDYTHKILGYYYPVSLSPTTTFAVPPIYNQNTIAAPDLKHIFVIGQTYDPGNTSAPTPYGDWNVYEYTNGAWQTLTSQTDATIPAGTDGKLSTAVFNAGLSNLDFLNDNQGWATNGANLYSIKNNHDGTTTWSQVYPPAGTTTTSAVPPVNVTRTPGTVIPAAHPGACVPPAPTPPPNNPPNNPSKHLLTGYWQDFTNGSTAMRLKDVNSNYNLVAVAFANADPNNPGGVTFSIDSGLSGALGGYDLAQFTNDVATLHAQGRKVVISVGGQNGAISVNDATSATNFANSVYGLMKTYGFDGVDIDLENGMNPTYMSSALKQLSALAGSSLIITLAPQTVDMQSTSSDYFQLALDIKSILTIVNMQYYNSGTMLGADGNVYAEGTVDFLTALATIQLQGGLDPSQVGLGVPASTSAAGSGYVSPTVVNDALDCLASGTNCGSFKPPKTYPDIGGAMTWSISWDAVNNYDFANTVGPHLSSLT